MQKASRRLTGRELADLVGLTPEAIRQAALRGKLTAQFYNGMRTYDLDEAAGLWPERLANAVREADAVQVIEEEAETLTRASVVQEEVAILAPITESRTRAVESALMDVYADIPSGVVRQLEAIRFNITARALEEIEVAYDLLRPYGKFTLWCEAQGMDASVLIARFAYLRHKKQVHAELTGDNRPMTLAAIAHGAHTTREERQAARLRALVTHNDFVLLWNGMFSQWVNAPDTAPEVKERCRLLASLLVEVAGGVGGVHD